MRKRKINKLVKEINSKMYSSPKLGKNILGDTYLCERYYPTVEVEYTFLLKLTDKEIDYCKEELGISGWS